ncbi:hypothetical protein KR49_11335 [Synechococcus sp. KORDI-49]|uniref:hypothetical protein n=1 Tax=Synechococcus sp. KORDI-49 TaxID=585423 RepID=UPI0004E058F3|nr:hypothetical protein [Synechococcus sp. KORDI-49]AII46997.1 hypothetical protein KR49_11335 [Synechococcus sp. KORDI-49]
MITSSPRTAFEQQLCTQLLSLSEVTETLADRVMVLEARLAEVEGRQVADAENEAIRIDAGELLSASEEKVRLLRDRLAPVEVVQLQPKAVIEDAVDAIESVDEDERVEDEAISDDTEYVDDPQIDLLSA